MPDGKEIAVVLENGIVLSVDITSEKITQLLKSEKSKAWSLKINEEKNMLAVGYTDGKIKLFDIQKSLSEENLIFTFSENNTSIEKMTFSNYGDLLAVASADKSIKIFNLAKKTQKPVDIKDIKSKTRSLIFDGENKLYVCGADHVIRKIELLSEKMVAPFCEQLKRNLTSSEWNQYIGETVPYEKTCKNR